MKGIRFIVDEAGNKTDVIINPKAHPKLWEDIHDRFLARRRAGERRDSLAVVRRRTAARKAR